MSEERVGAVTRRTVAATAGAAVGLGVGGPPGAVVGAAVVPLLEPLLDKMWSELRTDSRRRAAELVVAASEEAGCTAEELIATAQTSDPNRLLTALAMEAASRSSYPPKARALGRALAAGLLAEDDARIDEQQLVIAALTDLEAPHVALLDLIARYEPSAHNFRFWSAELYEPKRWINEKPWPEQRMWTQDQIASARPTLKPVLSGLLGTLQRHGLAVMVEPIGEALASYAKRVADDERLGRRSRASAVRGIAPAPTWKHTELGSIVLDYLRGAGAHFDDEPGAVETLSTE